MKVDKKKIITIAIILGVIILVLWLLFRNPKEKDLSAKISFPLKKGSSPSEIQLGVLNLQKYLNQKYQARIKEDGIWWTETESAVQTHLKRDNISRDVYYKWGLDKIA